MTFELWILVAATLLGVVHLSGRSGPASQWGAALSLVGRLLYLPLYALGIPWRRTFSWNLASLGLVIVGVQLFVRPRGETTSRASTRRGPTT